MKEYWLITACEKLTDWRVHGIDDCNDCSGGLTGNGFNDNLDCNEECYGPAIIDVYCQDFDGDSLGLELSYTELCDADIVENCTGDNCYAKYTGQIPVRYKDDPSDKNATGIDKSTVLFRWMKWMMWS